MERVVALFFWEWRKISSAPGFPAAGGTFLVVCSLLFLFVMRLFAVDPQVVRPTALWLQTFWIGSLILVPLLTMRSVAEERSSGALDCLLCTVISPLAVVLCKFLAIFGHYLLFWAVAVAIQPISLRLTALPLPFPLFTSSDILCAFTFLALVGALHCSIGLLFSSLTSSTPQAAAATSAALLIYFFGPRLIWDSSALPYGSILRNFVLRLEFFPFLGEWSAGIFDSRQIILHLSVSAVALLFSAALLRRP